MASATTKIYLMTQEKRELRDEIMEMQKSMHRVVFAFISVAIAMSGIFFGEFLTKHIVLKENLVVVLTQVEFAMSLFLTSLISHQNVSAGYISALEHKINEIVGENLLIYESYIVPNYILGSKGPFSYTSILIVLFVVGTLLVLVWLGYGVINSLFFGGLLTMELIIILGLLFWASKSPRQVNNDATKWMEEHQTT